MACKHIGVTDVSQHRTKLLEVFSDVPCPHRIEDRLHGLQVGTKTSCGDPGLVYILLCHPRSGEPQAPVAIEKLFEAVDYGRFYDISER